MLFEIWINFNLLCWICRAMAFTTLCGGWWSADNATCSVLSKWVN